MTSTPSGCCDLHGRNCELPSELCCERCTEADHPQHNRWGPCSNPDLSSNSLDEAPRIAAAVTAERAQVYAEIRQLAIDKRAEYRTPPCTNQGCPEVVGEHVHVLPFADLIPGGETGD